MINTSLKNEKRLYIIILMDDSKIKEDPNPVKETLLFPQRLNIKTG